MQTRAFLFEEAAEGPGVFQGAPPFWDQAVNGIAQQVGEFGHYGQPVSMACRPGMIPGRFWVRERRGDSGTALASGCRMATEQRRKRTCVSRTAVFAGVFLGAR